MGSWKDLTLADLAKSFARYRPFVAVVAAVVLVVGRPPRPQHREAKLLDTIQKLIGNRHRQPYRVLLVFFVR